MPTTTRVYRYGLQAPTENEPLIRDLIHCAHRYRNTLTQIERGRRDAIRAIENQVGLGDALRLHEEASAVVDAQLDLMKKHKSIHRTAKVPADMKETLALLKKSKLEASARLREAHRTLREDPNTALAMDRINKSAADLRRNARGHSGLARKGPHFGAWGTYQLVENAAEASRKSPLYDPLDWSAKNPVFLRFDGKGSVGIQIHGGLPQDAVTDHHQIQIRSIERVLSQSPRRNPVNLARSKPDGRRAKERATLRLRIGSKDPRGKEPVYGIWPMTLSRPLPKDAVIMSAAVHLRKIAIREQWYVTLTLRTDASRPAAERAGLCAINFGWRRVETGIRVAAWVAENGEEGEMIVPNAMLERMAHAQSIRSIRDNLFDIARPWAVLLFQTLEKNPAMPAWLKKSVATLHQWKSPDRLSHLAFQWKKHRFEGDTAAFEALDAWKRRNRHLWQYEAGGRQGALNHRLYLFRCTAKALAGKFTTLVHDGIDFTKFKTCPMVEVEKDNARARANMHASAPGEFRSTLINAFRGDVAVGDAVDITHTCPQCQLTQSFDAAIKIWHRCEGCGADWDQDFAAAKNLLRRYQAHTPSPSPTPQTSPTVADASANPEAEPRRARAKRLAKERRERIASADRDSDKAAE